jgi:BMFP domain-containing protein YqiC
MSDFDWDEDTFEDETPQGPKALRDLYGKTRDENKALKTELASLTARVRNQEVSQLFAAKGLPEKAVGLFPKDIDPTEENISKFVADYGDLFSSGKQEVKETVPESNAQNFNAEAQNQFTQMSQVTETGTPSTHTPLEHFQRMLNNPNLYDEISHADFMKAMREVAQSKV